MNLPIGHSLQNGKYILAEVIGQGGFGITYRGFWKTELRGALGSLKTDVPVCIKEYFFKDYCYRNSADLSVQIYSETGRVLFERFKEQQTREARILSELNHHGVVNVLEVFEENNTTYIAMEYIQGQSLRELLKEKGTLSEARTLRYIFQVCEAIDFVHQKSILHLDIKPSNILIDAKDNARLIDFGVSKRYDVAQQETSTTLLTLSKGFAAIEQYDELGIQQFTPSPDIYALGATIYNLITGIIPIESILRAAKPLQTLEEVNPQLDHSLSELVKKAMQIIPSDRYESVSEMLEAIKLVRQLYTEGKEEKLEDNIRHTEILSISEDDDATSYLPSDKAGSTTQVEANDAINRKKNIRKKTAIAALITAALSASGFGVINYTSKARARQALIAQYGSLPVFDQAANSLMIPDIEAVEQELSIYLSGLLITEDKDTQIEQEPTPVKIEIKKIEEPTTNTISPSKQEEQNTKRYQQLLNQGKQQMSASQFESALSTFEQAKKIRFTDEIFQLMVDCNLKKEAAELEQRKSVYEQMMQFGNLTIVRHRKTELYGAINNDYKETIPCVYLSVGRTSKGRAFERKDHLYDIYDNNGKRIKEGSTEY